MALKNMQRHGHQWAENTEHQWAENTEHQWAENTEHQWAENTERRQTQQHKLKRWESRTHQKPSCSKRVSSSYFL